MELDKKEKTKAASAAFLFRFPEAPLPIGYLGCLAIVMWLNEYERRV